MKPINEILSSAKLGNLTYELNYEFKAEEERKDSMIKAAEIINILFQELTCILPAFKMAWPTQSDFDNAKQLWTKIFIEEKINNFELIRKGIRKIAMSKIPFVPTVGQFIELCREKDNAPLANYHLTYIPDEKPKLIDPSIKENNLDTMRILLGMKR